jgi:hypothetical protein
MAGSTAGNAGHPNVPRPAPGHHEYGAFRLDWLLRRMCLSFLRLGRFRLRFEDKERVNGCSAREVGLRLHDAAYAVFRHWSAPRLSPRGVPPSLGLGRHSPRHTRISSGGYRSRGAVRDTAKPSWSSAAASTPLLNLRGAFWPRQIVSKWRKRFCEERLGGLESRPRRGRPSLFPPRGRRRGQGTGL